MPGLQFSTAKQRIAMCFVALCLALSAQMTLALIDRLQHALHVAHAPNMLAGDVFDLDHHDDHDADHDAYATPRHGHDHDDLPQGGDRGPLSHLHYSDGMLAPWLVSVPDQFASPLAPGAAYQFSATGHPDAPVWQRERPPKSQLEGLA